MLKSSNDFEGIFMLLLKSISVEFRSFSKDDLMCFKGFT